MNVTGEQFMGLIFWGFFICIFSFSYSTSVTLGDAVVICGGYDKELPEYSRNLKQIGKVIKLNRNQID